MTFGDEICAEGDFRISADGTWYHNGAPIRRARLVRLFATLLRRGADGGYWLVTPGEKVPVAVEDAPLLAVGLDIEAPGAGQVLVLDINSGARVRLDDGHPLVVRGTVDSPRPYLGLDGGLEALVARSVYYGLADIAVEGPGTVAGVWSAGAFFSLVPVSAADGDGRP